MPGKPKRVAQRLDLRGDDAEVLGHDRQVARGPPASASKKAAPGPFTQRPSTAVSASPGTSQYASKPRKWSSRTMSTSARTARKRSIHQA